MQNYQCFKYRKLVLPAGLTSRPIYTLHLVHYILHVASYMLHLTCCILHVASYTFHLTHCILHIPSYTRHLAHSFLHIAKQVEKLHKHIKGSFTHQVKSSYCQFRHELGYWMSKFEILTLIAFWHHKSKSKSKASYILHLTHCILHIASYTLHLTHCILHITSYTLHLTHCILHIASYTLHLTHCISHIAS